MNRQLLGTRAFNEALQDALNPPHEMKFEVERFGLTFRVGDKVIQTRNNYDKEVFNGDIGHIRGIETEPVKVIVPFDDAPRGIRARRTRRTAARLRHHHPQKSRAANSPASSSRWPWPSSSCWSAASFTPV